MSTDDIDSNHNDPIQSLRPAGVLDMLRFVVITKDLCALFSADKNYANKITTSDYHGFEKGAVPASDLERIAARYDVRPTQIQVELVVVRTDLSSQVHRHMGSSAYCQVLSAVHHLPDPSRAYSFVAADSQRDSQQPWSRLFTGNTVYVPAGVYHGFSVLSGGNLHFLSVQSPPISHEGGLDDYELMPNPPNLEVGHARDRRA